MIGMRIRDLKEEDAGLMLEWMHDDDVVEQLGTNFKEKTLNDCIKFIESSKDSSENLHKAIVDESDVYMGTVSLKHIDKKIKMAEFAITVRKEAMGRGYSKFGMASIINIGFDELDLEKIYWCVSKTNHRAIRFYEKNGYTRTVNVPNYFKEKYMSDQLEHFIWFCIEK